MHRRFGFARRRLPPHRVSVNERAGIRNRIPALAVRLFRRIVDELALGDVAAAVVAQDDDRVVMGVGAENNLAGIIDDDGVMMGIEA